MSDPAWLPKRFRIAWILFGILVCSLLVVMVRLSSSATVIVSGAVISVPLPSTGVFLRENNRCCEYLVVGDPDFRFLSNGWIEIEQMGAAHLLALGSTEVLVTTRKSTRWLTVITYCAKSQLSSSGQVTGLNAPSWVKT